jgi:hypothetical protein
MPLAQIPLTHDRASSSSDRPTDTVQNQSNAPQMVFFISRSLYFPRLLSLFPPSPNSKQCKQKTPNGALYAKRSCLLSRSRLQHVVPMNAEKAR